MGCGSAWVFSRGLGADQLLSCPCLPRYLLYDVNPPEGFNLRRDVYIRVASLLKTLLKTEEWVLVLPPWGRLYHWQSPDILQVRIPWSDFFDLPSLNRNIPVIEYEQFIAGETRVLYLGPGGRWFWWEHQARPETSARRPSSAGLLSPSLCVGCSFHFLHYQ